MPAAYLGNSTTKAARAASGGGYESAIEAPAEPTGAPSVSSVTDNGSTLTIAGSNFGAKEQAAPQLHDIGGNAYINGVLDNWTSGLADGATPGVTAGNPYLTFISDNEIDRTLTKRTAAQDCNYLLKGSDSGIGTIRSYCEGGTPPGYHQLYFAAWMAQKYHNGYWKTTGTATGGPFITDEPIEVVGTSYTGTYIGVEDLGADGPFHNFTIDTDSRSSSNFTGKTIRGLTSGAEVVFETVFRGGSGLGYDTPGNKYGRIRDNGSNAFDTETNTYSSIVGSVGDTDYYINRASVNDENYDQVTNDEVDNDRFVFHEWVLIIDPETNIGVFNCYIDGRNRSTGGEYVVDLSERDLTTSPYVSRFGFDGKHNLQQARLAEIYTDNTVQRVYLGNASTWDACTHKELQRPTNWIGTEITVAKNEGELAGESQWVYVAGPDGSINETGGAVS